MDFSINDLLDNDDLDSTSQTEAFLTKSLKAEVKENKEPLDNGSINKEDGALAYLLDMMSGKKYKLTKEESKVGISDTCDVKVEEEGNSHKISRSHCIIKIVGNKYYLKDISTNGTFISNRDNEKEFLRVPKEREVEIFSGTIIKLANRNYRFMPC